MLTGKRRHRTNWRGKLILQVEYTYDLSCSFDSWPRLCLRWRDAKAEDVT